MRRLAQLAALCCVILAFSEFCRPQEFPRIPLTWFDEAEQHGKGWKVDFHSDLIFNQRFSISIFAWVPVPKKTEPHGTLHLVVRVADENGKYYPGTDYTRIDLSKLDPKVDHLQWHTNFYVTPGVYRVVLLVFDDATEQHYLWRETVKVDRPNILPDLDRNLPRVEFLDARHLHAPVGELLPINNKRPLRVDIVMNLTGDQQLSLSRGFFRRLRQFTVEGALLGSVSVLSQLHPANGCVRTSAIDIIHLQVARDRAIADANLDWQQVSETIVKYRDTQTVDVKTLAGRQKAREFFRHFIDKVVADGSGCGQGGPPPDRAVIVVSDALEFPSNSDKDPVAPPEEHGGRFYHVKITFPGLATFDQVGHMLGPLHPRRFTINDPGDLRRAIATIIHDLEEPQPQSAQ